MKFRILLAFSLLLCAMLSAAPHTMLPLSFEQPDGTSINIYASGDEFHNWLHDANNYTIVKNDAGWYVYARQDGEEVAPTELVVGKDAPSRANISPGINISRQRINAKYARYNNTMRNYSNGRSPHSGEFNNVVIFIRFSDDPQFSGQIGFYENIFNGSETFANSMKSYFLAASYDQLNISSTFYPAPNGSVVVSYQDIQPRNYFRVYSSSNPIGYEAEDDEERANREFQLLARAVAAVSDQIPTDLVIDGDNDGYVDNTCFIIQGQPDGWAELLWPHRWSMYGAEALINGAQVWDFNFQLESSLGYSGASVLSHEMFHSLGAPDLYRYYDDTITPIGNWDLMAGNQNPPQHMSAWMKYRYGEWIPNPPMITQSGRYTLNPVASSSTNNIWRVPSWRANESYVLEYRRPDVYYDDNLPGTGLLVYRLDTRESGNASGPPDELYIYRPNANNTTTNGSLSNAAFSATANRTAINESTIPSGFLGNNTAGGLNIYDISEAGETISFSIKISDIQLTAPVGGEMWLFGISREIKWKAKSSTGNVKLEFSQNMGEEWSVISANTPNDGSFTWSNLPPINSQECLIRITHLSNNHSDTSTYPFTLLSYLDAPVAVYPLNEAVSAPTNPLISWQPALGATFYHFQLATDIDFENIVRNLNNHPTSSYQVTGLSPFTLYYWRVASIADIGTSQFCDTQSFTTGAISEVPSVPQLVSPANFASAQPMNPLFTWNPANLALRYRLQIARDQYYSNIVLDIADIEQTSFRSSVLSANTSYYWRVSAINDFGNSNFSSSRRFSTGSSVGAEDEQAPVVINKLMPNYPNPFNPHTTISFSLINGKIPASLDIYNTKGQLVRQLYSGIPQASQMSIVWDGLDQFGKPVGSGIYLYRLQNGEFQETRKMLLAK